VHEPEDVDVVGDRSDRSAQGFDLELLAGVFDDLPGGRAVRLAGARVEVKAALDRETGNQADVLLLWVPERVQHPADVVLEESLLDRAEEGNDLLRVHG